MMTTVPSPRQRRPRAGRPRLGVKKRDRQVFVAFTLAEFDALAAAVARANRQRADGSIAVSIASFVRDSVLITLGLA